MQVGWICYNELHNQVRETIADVMKEVCHDVQLEPQLIAIEDEEKSLSQQSTF